MPSGVGLNAPASRARHNPVRPDTNDASSASMERSAAGLTFHPDDELRGHGQTQKVSPSLFLARFQTSATSSGSSDTDPELTLRAKAA